MNFLIMPMWFLSGAMFPPTGLPEWLQVLVRGNPLTYGVDVLRWLILGVSYYPPWFGMTLLLVFGSVITCAAVFFFNRSEY